MLSEQAVSVAGVVTLAGTLVILDPVVGFFTSSPFVQLIAFAGEPTSDSELVTLGAGITPLKAKSVVQRMRLLFCREHTVAPVCWANAVEHISAISALMNMGR